MKRLLTFVFPLVLLASTSACDVDNVFDDIDDVLNDIEDFVDDLDHDHHGGGITIIIGDDDHDWWDWFD